MRLERWLRESGVTPTRAEDLVLAVYEALANAVEHAYQPGHPHPSMWLHAACDRDHVLITVSDAGTWRTPGEPGDRGRGVALMRCLTTDVHIDPTPHGTIVRLRATLVPASTRGAGHTSAP